MDGAHDYDEIWRASGATLWRAVYAYGGGRKDVADDAVAEAVDPDGTIRVTCLGGSQLSGSWNRLGEPDPSNPQALAHRLVVNPTILSWDGQLLAATQVELPPEDVAKYWQGDRIG